MSKPIELYASAHCEHCAAAREDFEWCGIEFIEYDVDPTISRVSRRCRRPSIMSSEGGLTT